MVKSSWHLQIANTLIILMTRVYAGSTYVQPWWPPRLHFSFFHHLHIRGLGAHSAETLELPLLLLSGYSLIGHRGLVSTSFVYRGTLVGCTVVPAVVLALLVLTGTVVGIAAFFSFVASFSCIHHVVFGTHMIRTSQLLMLSQFDSIHHHWWPVPALTWQGVIFTSLWHRSSYLLWSYLAWSDALTASLLDGGLMMTGRLVFNCLLYRNSEQKSHS